MIDWKNGLVEYLPNSTIEIGEGGHAFFESVDFEGFDIGYNNRAIFAYGADDIEVIDANFNNFELAIEAYRMYQPTDVFKVALTNFNNCLKGISGELCKNLELNGTVFTPYNNSSYALQLHNVEKVYFRGDIQNYHRSDGAISILNDLSANNFGLKEITQFTMNDANISNGNIGIGVYDYSKTNIIVTNSSTITNNNYGIHADGFSESETVFANVTVDKGSAINDNQTGIFIGKGLTYVQAFSGKSFNFGTVEMSCAEMINNHIGVLGEDLYLNIDACLNSGQPTADCDYTQTNPNHFKIGTALFSKLFEICYVDRNVSEINATGNYWESGLPSSNPSHFKIGTFLGNVCAGTSINDSNSLNSAPVGCDGGVALPPDGTVKTDCFSGGNSTTCFISSNGNNVVMNEQYYEALAQYVNEDYIQSATAFEVLANVPDSEKNMMCEICQHYIHIARSRTFYNTGEVASIMSQDNSTLEQTSGKQLINKNEEAFDIQIFPNPTNGILNIKTGTSVSNLKIMDINGGILVSEKDVLDFEVDTQSWTPGVYIVEIIDNMTAQIIQRKVVVQP